MRSVNLFTQEELNKLAGEAVRNLRGNHDYSFKRWELEISTDKWPRLHIYYVNNTTEFLLIKELEMPK